MKLLHKRFDALFALSKILIDGLILNGSLILAYMIRMHWYDAFGFEAPFTLVPFYLYGDLSWKIGLFVLGVLGLNGRYSFRERSVSAEIFQAGWAFSSALGAVIVFFFFGKIEFFSRLIFGLAWIIGLMGLILVSLGWKFGKQRLQKKGIGQKRIILLSDGNLGKEAKERLSEDPQFVLVETLTKSRFSQLGKILETESIDSVYVAAEKTGKFTVGQLAHIAHIHHVQFFFFPDELALDLAAVTPLVFRGTPLLALESTKITAWNYLTKSILDRCIGLGLFVLASPIFLVTMLLIWCENRTAPIFYRSNRIGKNGENFPCLKFRSMVPDAEAKKSKLQAKNERQDGVLFKLKNDPRVTPLGKKLRQWSIDELPQLINVLRGEMSMIGPRPHLPEEVAQYSETERYLLAIKPGISGMAQVNGKSDLTFQEEMKYELFYLKNWSFWLDVQIFFRTIAVIFRGDNQ